VLTGGRGEDTFVFDTAYGPGNVDTLTDFDAEHDALYLDSTVFSKLGAGSLSSRTRVNSSYFELREHAAHSNDYLLYNRATGILSYDPDELEVEPAGGNRPPRAGRVLAESGFPSLSKSDSMF
jgi:Ca2+-binding RTX toxin-like protein